MNPTPRERRANAPPGSPTGFPRAALGAAGLAAVFALLPVLGDSGTVSFAALSLSYVLVIIPVGVLVHGLLTLSACLPTPGVLLLGAATGLLGVVAAYLGGRPEALAGGPAPLALLLLFLADVLRIQAACALALALARHVNSVGVAFLLAGAGAGADLFSVLAGPTKALLREGSPALDFLLVIFPTFGQPLGFALGVADFVFLALFTAVARYLPLRPLPTLIAGCMATLLAMLVSLLMTTPLPALPFISLSFIFVNADLALAKIRRP